MKSLRRVSINFTFGIGLFLNFSSLLIAKESSEGNFSVIKATKDESLLDQLPLKDLKLPGSSDSGPSLQTDISSDSLSGSMDPTLYMTRLKNAYGCFYDFINKIVDARVKVVDLSVECGTRGAKACAAANQAVQSTKSITSNFYTCLDGKSGVSQ